MLKSSTEVTQRRNTRLQKPLMGRVGEVFAWVAGISFLMVLISASLVVFVAPEARQWRAWTRLPQRSLHPSPL